MLMEKLCRQKYSENLFSLFENKYELYANGQSK